MRRASGIALDYAAEVSWEVSWRRRACSPQVKGIAVLLLILGGAAVPFGMRDEICTITSSSVRSFSLLGVTVWRSESASRIEQWMHRHRRPVRHAWVETADHRFRAYGLDHDSRLNCYVQSPRRMDRVFAQVETTIPAAEIAAMVDRLERGEVRQVESDVGQRTGIPTR